MFIKFRLILISLLYFFGLEIIVFRPSWVLFVLLFLLPIAFFEGKKTGKKWIFSILPVFFVLFSAILLNFISIIYEQQVFILLASGLFYILIVGTYRLGLYESDQTARGMIMAATSAVIFFTFTSTYGIYLNFLIPLYVLMLVLLLTTFLVSHQYFSIIEASRQKVTLYSFLLSLIMVEIIWTMNFWPFGYLTTGVIALILYYILWDLTQSYLLNLLSRKRVVANMVLFSMMISIVLLSSKWLPIV